MVPALLSYPAWAAAPPPPTDKAPRGTQGLACAASQTVVQDKRQPGRGNERSVAPVEIRQVRTEEYQSAGRLVVAAYRALPSAHLSDDYAAELADVVRRAAEAEVLVAVEDEVVGCVTFVPDGSSPWAELLEEGEAGIRMLAVLPSAQGRGVCARPTERVCLESAPTGPGGAVAAYDALDVGGATPVRHGRLQAAPGARLVAGAGRTAPCLPPVAHLSALSSRHSLGLSSCRRQWAPPLRRLVRASRRAGLLYGARDPARSYRTDAARVADHAVGTRRPPTVTLHRNVSVLGATDQVASSNLWGSELHWNRLERVGRCC